MAVRQLRLAVRGPAFAVRRAVRGRDGRLVHASGGRQRRRRTAAGRRQEQQAGRLVGAGRAAAAVTPDVPCRRQQGQEET